MGWVKEQNHVIDASSSTTQSAPYNSQLVVNVDVVPSVSDQDLTELAHSVESHCRGLGWPTVYIIYALGDGFTFGGVQAASLPIFLDLRQEKKYDSIYTAGNLEVTLPDADAHSLLEIVKHIQDIARDHGGVQSNLDVKAASGSLAVRGTAEVLPTEGSILLNTLVTSGIVWREAEVFATGYRSQSIWITVDTEEERSALLAIATAAMVPGTSQENAYKGGVIVSDIVEVRTFLESELAQNR